MLMSPFPLLLILIALIRRPWPRWLQDRICDTPAGRPRAEMNPGDLFVPFRLALRIAA
jgi:hypothetical protein